MVLLSGGVDSAACVDFYLDFGRPVCAVFIDYGQPALNAERDAAAQVANHYAISLDTFVWRGRTEKSAGLIPARNLFLLAATVMERPPSVSVVALGVHDGTDYKDCSQQFLDQIERAIHAAGEDVSVAAPFASWRKTEIYEYARRRRVPIHLTHSCEAGVIPCGVCLSCCDRKLIDASA